MLIFIGLIVVSVIILYKRSTEIVTVNPLGRRQDPLPGAASEEGGGSAPDLAGFLGTLQQAAKQSINERGTAAVRSLVQNNQIVEAVQLYRRLHGVDLKTAKTAIEALMHER